MCWEVWELRHEPVRAPASQRHPCSHCSLTFDTEDLLGPELTSGLSPSQMRRTSPSGRKEASFPLYIITTYLIHFLVLHVGLCCLPTLFISVVYGVVTFKYHMVFKPLPSQSLKICLVSETQRPAHSGRSQHSCHWEVRTQVQGLLSLCLWTPLSAFPPHSLLPPAE